MPPGLTYYGYGDESHWNQDRYRSLCLVTLPAAFVPVISEQVRAIVTKHGVQEFAWKKVRTHDRQTLAHDLCDLAIDSVCDEKMRIDVLIWDTWDSRHHVTGRDDTENLARMYYHCMKTVVNLRWPSGSRWEMRVDRRADIDWSVLRRSVNRGVRKAKRTRQLDVNRRIEIEGDDIEVVEVRASTEPLVQLADLFAGLGAFSWNRAKPFWQWRSSQAGQLQLFAESAAGELSNSEVHKAATLSHLGALLGQQNLRMHWVNKGLKTKDPSIPVNFWLYVPQRPEDKAPIHHKRKRAH